MTRPSPLLMIPGPIEVSPARRTRRQVGDADLVGTLHRMSGPAATVGKAFGWSAASLALLVWTIIGIGLALHWVNALVNRAVAWTIAIFIAFSGLDIVGRMLILPIWRDSPSQGTDQFEWWSGMGQVPSHFAQVQWGPQHTLAAWIGVGVIVHAATRRSLGWVVAVALLCAPLTPLATLGLVALAPYLALRLVARRAPIAPSSPITSPITSLGPPIAAAALVVPAVLYLVGATTDLPPPYDEPILFDFAITSSVFGTTTAQAALGYVLLVLFEVAVFVVLVRRSPSVAASSDGRRIVTGSDDRSIRVWNSGEEEAGGVGD